MFSGCLSTAFVCSFVRSSGQILLPRYREWLEQSRWNLHRSMTWLDFGGQGRSRLLTWRRQPHPYRCIKVHLSADWNIFKYTTLFWIFTSLVLLWKIVGDAWQKHQIIMCDCSCHVYVYICRCIERTLMQQEFLPDIPYARPFVCDVGCRCLHISMLGGYWYIAGSSFSGF